MNKIYFFNAANFNFAEIDLRKRNVFFVGDNGSGKTTAIRAIHFYYNSDVKALGIDPNKESFKEFYFKYDNSFLVYDFGEYFCLMYKRSGDIKRVFSRQKFELSRVLRGDEVVDLKEVIAYANEAPLKYRPQTNDEYKKIIYGLVPKLSDFKLTTVRNYNTFINLYNKIFNVNRAVFDAKSIKEIIFTTLDRVEAGEINYEDFLNELIEYRQYFIFYRKFKEKEKDIEKLYIYKNALLNLNEEIETLLQKIAFKKEIEEKEIEKIKEEIKESERKKRVVLKQIGYFDKKIKQVKEDIEKRLIELNATLEEIKRLKEKFTFEKLKEARKKVATKDELSAKLIQLQTSLNELIKGIKNQIEEIEEEINRLKREKRILKEKAREDEIREKRNLEEIYFEKEEKLKEEYVNKEKSFIEKISDIEDEIKEKIRQKEEYLREIDEVKVKFKRKIDEVKENFEKEKIDLKEKIRSSQIEIDKYLNENVKLKREINRLKNDFEDEVFKIKKEYEKNIAENIERIEFFENILKTKPNSFKEFLNQNVDNWEEELYPVIDEKLLSMDIDELKPKFVSDRVFGIELDKSKLKSIPTMKEAEESIERLNLANESLKDELNKKLEILKKEFEAKKIEIESEISVNEEKAKTLKEEIEKFKKLLKELEVKEKEEIDKLNQLRAEEIKLIEINIRKIDEQIRAFRSKIDDINRKIKALKRELRDEIEKLRREKQKEFEKIKAKIKEELLKAENLIDEKINELNIKKNKISKDERIEELNREIKEIEKRLDEVSAAERFLAEYEEKRSFIESEGEVKKEIGKYEEYLKRIEKFFEKMDKKLNSKANEIEITLKKLNEKLDLINEGLRKVASLKLPESKKETNEFLSILVDELKRKEGEFKDKLIDFKSTASTVKTALERFAVDGLEVNFNFEKLEKLIPAELEKVDELYIFKDKKFEVLNKTRLKGLKNLLSAIFEKKLDNFERSKEDFLAQVKRINKNLSKVDFGIVRDIKIEIEETNKNILKVFDDIKRNIEDLIVFLDNEESLFFDRSESDRKLRKIEELFNFIKKEVKEESFTLIDVVDINVKFIENEKENTLKLIKNESSTGGSILLKIAIAVSLLELFIKEKAPLFLILDEVSVLSTKNQKLLKEYVNERGLGVIYVTPDLPLVDVEEIDIYKFRNVGGEFEVVKLIADEGIKISEK